MFFTREVEVSDPHIRYPKDKKQTPAQVIAEVMQREVRPRFFADMSPAQKVDYYNELSQGDKDIHDSINGGPPEGAVNPLYPNG
jgi:hypothetical protein